MMVLVMQVPRDYPSHMNVTWLEFLTKPWAMRRPMRDDNIEYINSTERICQYHFKYNEVVPCKLDDLKMGKRERADYRRDRHKREGWIKEYAPIWGTENFEPSHNQTGVSSPCYELKVNGSGEPYESVIDMRRDKLENHLAVANWSWVKGHEIAMFDRMSDQSYVSSFLRRIEKQIGLNATCDNIPSPKWKSKKSNVSQEFMDWITKRVDWEIEAQVGYWPVV